MSPSSSLPFATRVVATAGHVDHGKSTLIHALTGTDPDRFPEEKARGLTIDLGFGFADLDHFRVGFVDVPGHARFIRNMLAGVGAVECVLLVVAANEGWMPQTAEHVQILQLFDIQHGVIALTKADLVDEEELVLAQLEVGERVAGTPLSSWPVVPVATHAGTGLDELREALDDALASSLPPLNLHRSRLWVDRSFAVKGAGTVVTGTLTLGPLAINDDVIIEPIGRRVRIRGIQSGHVGCERAEPGTRVALNLVGVEHDEISRGDAVVGPDVWTTSSVVDVDVQLVANGPALPANTSVTVHVGSSERSARWSRLDADRCIGRLRFAAPVALQPGDRMVLRSSARKAVVGGAVVLEVAAGGSRRDAVERSTLPVLERVTSAHPWLTVAELIRLGGFDPTTIETLLIDATQAGRIQLIDGMCVPPDVLAALQRAAIEVVRRHHETHPDSPGLPIAELQRALGIDAQRARAIVEHSRRQPAQSSDMLTIHHDLVSRTDHALVVADTPEGRRLLHALRAQPFNPPSPAELDVPMRVVRLLERDNLVVEYSDVWFAQEAIEAAHRIVGEAVLNRGTLTVGEIRDLLGSSRKFVIPIVQSLDSAGITRRRGDTRIPGPAATSVLD